MFEMDFQIFQSRSEIIRQVYNVCKLRGKESPKQKILCQLRKVT